MAVRQLSGKYSRSDTFGKSPSIHVGMALPSPLLSQPERVPTLATLVRFHLLAINMQSVLYMGVAWSIKLALGLT